MIKKLKELVTGKTTTSRKIICAAIRLKNNKILCAPTYNCKIMQKLLFDNCRQRKQPAHIIRTYGFVDQYGKFYNKKEAM